MRRTSSPRRIARWGGLVLTALLVLPLCGIEGLYCWGLGKIDQLPSVPSGPVLPPYLERAVWVSAGERLPFTVEPVRGWHVLWASMSPLRARRTGNLPGESAATVAARLWLLARPQTTPLNWHLRGWALKVWLTRHWSPEQLIHFISQNAAFGRNAVGISAAARAYFGKEASALALQEIALLMALQVYPSRHDPDCHPERALRAREQALIRLLDEGAIPRDAFEHANALPLEFVPDPSRPCP